MLGDVTQGRLQILRKLELPNDTGSALSPEQGLVLEGELVELNFLLLEVVVVVVNLLRYFLVDVLNLGYQLRYFLIYVLNLDIRSVSRCFYSLHPHFIVTSFVLKLVLF